MARRSTARFVHYALYLLGEFRWPILVIVGLTLCGGTLFTLTLKGPSNEDLAYGEACYAVFMLLFVQPVLPFPPEWYNQALFFLLPVVGVGAIADSIVRMGFMVFSSKRKLQEWWIMEASTCRNHVVVCGLGRVGYRIARELLALGESFVVVERNRETMFADEIVDANVPLLFGEARLRKTLEQAGVARARAIILATDDDLTNLDAALTAREINPEIRVVLRLFDDTLANKVAGSFKLPAISTSQVSAPAFVAAATGRCVLHSFKLDGQEIHVADVQVERLSGRTVRQAQADYDVSIVLHKGAGASDLNPNHDRALQRGDTIVVVAPIEKIRRVETENRPS
jgi:Trk K+ transport system NAD-binding subunit